MSHSRKRHHGAPALAAAAAICAGLVTSCGATREPVETAAYNPPVELTTTSTTAPTADPGPPAEVWTFLEQWQLGEAYTYAAVLTAASWQAAADYAVAVAPRPAPVPPQRRSAVPAVVATPKPVQGHTGPVSGAPGGFLACVRQRESRGSYTVVNGSSGAGGAYQFLPGTWAGSGAAARTGVPRAELASPAQQDAEAARLYASAGRSPWAGPGC